MKEIKNYICIAQEAPFYMNKKYVGISYIEALLEQNKIASKIENEEIDYKGEKIKIKRIFTDIESLKKLDKEILAEITDTTLFINETYENNLNELYNHLKINKLPFLARKRILKLLDLENSSINELTYRSIILEIELIEMGFVMERIETFLINYESSDNFKEDIDPVKLLNDFLYNLFIKTPKHNLKVFIYNRLNNELIDYQSEIGKIKEKYKHIFIEAQ